MVERPVHAPFHHAHGKTLRSDPEESQTGPTVGLTNRTRGFIAATREDRGHDFRGNASGDAGLALQPPNILDDLIDILARDCVDLRHVPELPVVCLHPVGCSPLERLIAVVVGFIDLVHEWRTLLRTDT